MTVFLRLVANTDCVAASVAGVVAGAGTSAVDLIPLTFIVVAANRSKRVFCSATASALLLFENVPVTLAVLNLVLLQLYLLHVSDVIC